MVECNLAKVEVAGSNPVSRSSDQGPELIGSGLFNPAAIEMLRCCKAVNKCGNNSVVECNLAKVEVAGSNPVSRSR